MDFVKAFRLMLDADVKGAVDGLTGFESAAKKAEATTATTGKGITGSLGNVIAKTGLGSKAMETFGVSAGTMGTMAVGAVGVAGGAIAKFALDGAKRFGDLGEEVEKFASISGTQSETASKWIAVADDYGVGADGLANAVGKLGKALGTNVHAFDEYGVSVVKAKDGTIDLNGTLFNVIDAYNKTVDPTKKSKLATEAWGKSYQTLIPLLDEGADKIRSSFDKVSKAQILNADDLKRAEDYRLAMDNLHETVTDLQLTIGKQLIPVIVSLGDHVTAVTGPVNDLMDALPSGSAGKGIQEITGWVLKLSNPLFLAAGATKDLQKRLDSVNTETAPLAISMFDDMTTAIAGIKPELDKIPPPLDAIAQHFVDWKANQDALGTDIAWIAKSRENYDALGADILKIVADQEAAIVGTDEYKRRTSQMKDAVEADLASVELKWQELTGTITGDQALLNLQQQFDDVKTKGVEALAAVQSGAADAEQKARDSALAYDDLKLKVVDYGKEVLGLPVEKVTTLLTEIKEGELQRVEDQLEILTRNRKVNIDIIAKGGAGYGSLTGGVGRAAGGPVSAYSTYRVNERGEEYFTPMSNGYVSPAGKWASSGGSNWSLATPPIVINNYRRDLTSADLHQVLAMARLS